MSEARLLKALGDSKEIMRRRGGGLVLSELGGGGATIK